MDPIAAASYGTAAALALYPLKRAVEVWQRERRWERHLAGQPHLAASDVPADPLFDRFYGCLLGGAIGDGLGRLSESLAPWLVQLRFGTVRDFHPGLLRRVRRRGSVTDDTQLTLLTAASLDEQGRFDPERFAAGLIDWLGYRVGAGRATVESAKRLQLGVSWTESAETGSAGNGTVIRIAPIALVWHHDDDRRASDAILSAKGTHGHPLAHSGARLMADALALALQRTGERPAGLVPALLEREADPAWRDVLQRLLDLGDRPAQAGLAKVGNSGFVAHTVAAALWLFHRRGEAPEAAIVTAVNGGGDTDSIGCLVGQLCGAWHGATALPERWRQQVMGAEVLAATAAGLLQLHQSLAAESSSLPPFGSSP